MLVVAVFINGAGKVKMLPPSEIASVGDVDPEIFYFLSLHDAAQWSFVCSFELVNPPRVITDLASFNAWHPSAQQIHDMKERILKEEVARLRREVAYEAPGAGRKTP